MGDVPPDRLLALTHPLVFKLLTRLPYPHPPLPFSAGPSPPYTGGGDRESCFITDIQNGSYLLSLSLEAVEIGCRDFFPLPDSFPLAPCLVMRDLGRCYPSLVIRRLMRVPSDPLRDSLLLFPFGPRLLPFLSPLIYG